MDSFEDWVTANFGRAPLRRVLPLLHGEGVGHSRLRDPCRVGGAADQGLLASAARSSSSLAPARGRTPTTLIEEFQLPAARARARCGRRFARSVGGARHPGPPQPPRASAIRHEHERRRQRRRSSTNGQVDGRRRRRRALEHSAQRARPQPRAARARRGPRRRASACATATLVPRRARDRRRASPSRTTGSTSTTRGPAPGGCRTSAPGARTW